MKTKDSIAVITKDNIRVLHTHGTNHHKTANSIVLGKNDFMRIKTSSVVISKEEENKRLTQIAKEKAAATEAARERRARMEEFELQRNRHAHLSEAEQEAAAKANYLLARAQTQLDEEEDEIKRLNELMLYTKCVAIRDEQVKEKKLISKEKKLEDMRLDAMMEMERVNDLKRMEEREVTRNAELRKGAEIIRKQIEELHEAALLEAERKDQEAKLILNQLSERVEQEKSEKQSKIRAQRELMNQVLKANQDAIAKKKTQKLEEQEADRKLLQYLMEKERKEIEKDKEAQSKKAEREKELARLRAAQKRATDKQAEQDALRAKRAYEAYEREWRRKEKEAVEKKVREEEQLRIERHKQQLSRDQAIAYEAQQLKTEFFENLERQKALEAKLKGEVSEKQSKNRIHSVEVQKQIREKELDMKKEREEFFQEGYRLANERNEKKKKVDTIVKRKMAELRGLGVPEKYCAEVERKMKLFERGRLTV